MYNSITMNMSIPQELETTLTQKGQVTIPQRIRLKLGLKPRDKIKFELSGDRVTLWPVSSRLLAGYGAVNPKNRPEDFKKIREEFEQGVAKEA